MPFVGFRTLSKQSNHTVMDHGVTTIFSNYYVSANEASTCHILDSKWSPRAYMMEKYLNISCRSSRKQEETTQLTQLIIQECPWNAILIQAYK